MNNIGVFDYFHGNYTFREHLDMAVEADRLGFHFYFVAEHHKDGKFAQCPSPGVFLGAAATLTNRIRLGPLGYVVPLWNPVRLAEEIAMLDDASNGRLEVGLVSGINQDAFQDYGVSWDAKADLFWQGTAALRKSFQRLNYLPIWHPSRDLASLLKAAGMGWSTAQWCAPRVAKVRSLFDAYREVYRQHNYRVVPRLAAPRLAIMREIYVAETDQRAREIGGANWLLFWSRFVRHPLPENISDSDVDQVSRAERAKELRDVDGSIADNSLICGSPETVIKHINRLTAAGGANCFLGDFAFGDLFASEVKKSMSLFATEVAPALEGL